jgi:hypothetical protein
MFFIVFSLPNWLLLASFSELGVTVTLLGWYPFLPLRGQMTRRIAAAPAHPFAATTLPPDSDAPPSASNTMTASPMMSPARSNSCILAASIFVSPFWRNSLRLADHQELQPDLQSRVQV